MLGGLYGDLPPPSSTPADDDKPSAAVWSSATKMAPPTLRKPSTTFAPSPSLLRNQHPRPTPKTTSAPAATAAPPPLPLDTTTTSSFQPALVAVQSTVLEEYDPARPNDYEDYRREKLKRAKEAEMKKELERRRREDEEREREREQREREALEREERDYQSRASSLNISGEEAWKRRAAMSGPSQRTPSSPPHGGGFTIGSSSSSGLGVGAGGQMTAAQRMMAKMGWKEGQGLGKQEQGITRTTSQPHLNTPSRHQVLNNVSYELNTPAKMSAVTKKTSAAKKAAPAVSGPSYLDMIKQVIVGRPEDARAGVSRQTLKKEIPVKFPKTKTLSESAFAAHVNKAIAKGVESGSLTQAKNNGKVKLAAKEKKTPAAKKSVVAKKAPSTKKPAAKKAPSTAAKKPAAKKTTTSKTKSSTSTKATKPAAKKTTTAAKPKAKRAPLVPTQAAAPKTKKAAAKK